MEPDDELVERIEREAKEALARDGILRRTDPIYERGGLQIDPGERGTHDSQLLNERYLNALKIVNERRFNQRKNGRWSNERLIEELDVDESDAEHAPEVRDILDERSRICIWCGAVQPSLEALDEHEAECGAG